MSNSVPKMSLCKGDVLGTIEMGARPRQVGHGRSGRGRCGGPLCCHRPAPWRPRPTHRARSCVGTGRRGEAEGGLSNDVGVIGKNEAVD